MNLNIDHWIALAALLISIYSSIRLTCKDRKDNKEKKSVQKRLTLLEAPYFEIKRSDGFSIQIAVKKGTVKNIELDQHYNISEPKTIKKSDELVCHEGDVFFESQLSFIRTFLPQYVGKEDPKGPIMTINFKDFADKPFKQHIYLKNGKPVIGAVSAS